MTFSKLKTMKEERGFTIVELLIVIIVIAILAAIVIVAYNGVTARANTSKAQTNAVAIQKKAEAYNADNSSVGGNGVYPASATTATTGWTALTTASPTMLGAIPAGITIGNAAPTATNGTTYVQYVACATGAANSNTANGYYVGYWNFTTSAVITISGGSATSGACPSGTTASTS